MYNWARYVPTSNPYKEILIRAYQYEPSGKVSVDHRIKIQTSQAIKQVLDLIRVRYNYTCVIIDNIRLSELSEESISVYAPE